MSTTITDEEADESWIKMCRNFNINPTDLEHRIAISKNNTIGFGWLSALLDNNPEAEEHPWRQTS